MNCRKYRLFSLLLSIVLVSPMVAGEWLHRFLGCSERDSFSQNPEENQRNPPQSKQNNAPKPVIPGKGTFPVCKLLASISQAVAVSVDWVPETRVSGNQDVVSVFSTSALYQNFEYGRAPPSFAWRFFLNVVIHAQHGDFTQRKQSSQRFFKNFADFVSQCLCVKYDRECLSKFQYYKCKGYFSWKPK